MTTDRINDDVADRLEEVSRLLVAQRANPFRAAAYQRAADTIRRLSPSVSEILQRDGLEGLQRLPGVGPVIARAVRELVTRGRLPMLDRLRGESEPPACSRRSPASAARSPIG